MNNPNLLLEKLKGYEVAGASEKAIGRVNKLMNELGDYETVRKVGKSAGGLYLWVTNTVKCYSVHKEVEPLNKKVKEM